MTLVDLLEQDLCAAYAQEEMIYVQALHLAEQVSGAVRQGESGDALLTRITDLLAQVGKLEEELEPCKERWRREGTHPGPELRVRLANVATLIRETQERLDAALRKAA